jgi:hypothetical protein
MQTVIAEITESAGDGDGGFARRRRTGVYRGIRMPVFERFETGRKEALPAAYLIPPRLRGVVDLLRRQGVPVESLTVSWRAQAQTFAIDTLAAGALFEGHRTVQPEGRWSSRGQDTILVAGWYLVRTEHRLGLLAAYLLEPASEDGVVTWNLLDRELQPRSAYPILRAVTAPRTAGVTIR